ncbi:tripartite motif-containing protein 60-like [Cavia porcellus]|uniref:tripartite motif-containing protein 60-like n=1 Tax=Cavia porcellus TaxID=10141 RepID=UPI00022B6FD3|nr:tripartite motif-containing protein 60-like [Cavia porcellus]
MAFSGTLTSLQQESHCPLCFDYFKDPVTIECGHNFCCDCLSACWKDLTDRFPCPVCRFNLASPNFIRNSQLSSLTQAVQQLVLRRSKRKQEEAQQAVCEPHQRALTLFCEQDLELLCAHCSFAPEHRRHNVSLVEEAAPEHRRRLESSVEPLRSKLEQVEKMIALQDTKTLELHKEAVARRKEIEAEFERVRQFLQGEQEATLRRMDEEEAEILAELNQHLTTISNYASGQNFLLKEVEGKGAVSCDVALLSSLKSIEDKRQTLGRPEPSTTMLPSTIELSGFQLKLPAQFSGLERIVQLFQVNLLFDPTSAHPQLEVSADRKSVTYLEERRRVGYSPNRFYLCLALLSQQFFYCGRHYWQVEVGAKPKWTLGACQGALPRNWRNEPDLYRGFWALGRCNSSYLVFGTQKARIVPQVRPNKVGVFLDYELGEISFYNVDDGSVLYTFHDRFTRNVWPYFYAGRDSEPLRLCPVSKRGT